MSLFARGNWSIFGVDKSNLEDFKKSLNDSLTMFQLSQAKAALKTKGDKVATVGINPFDGPRLDERPQTIDVTLETMRILEFELTDNAAEQIKTIDLNLLGDNFGQTEGAFSLGYEGCYGFWAVFNEWEDLTDIASKREQFAYSTYERPYKFLNKEDKKALEMTLLPNTVTARVQFPVLVDFVSGLVFCANTNAEAIGSVRDLLLEMGAKPVSLHWEFGSYDWPTLFLNKVASQTKFKDEMATRADERSRFSKEEIESLDDKNMEKIVSTFFAISELESGRWAALATPAKIKLRKTLDAVTVADPSNGFTLLNISDEGQVASAALRIQELGSYFTKKGEERVTRNDTATFDINDNMNNQDAGVALLRGFDLPQFRKDLLKELKKNQATFDIHQYWSEWFSQMRGAVTTFIADVADLLNLDGTDPSIKPFGLIEYQNGANAISEEVSVNESGTTVKAVPA